MSALFSISVNRKIHDKPPEWRPEFADDWQSVQVDLTELQQTVRQGVALVPAAMSSSHRSSAAFLHADLAVVDIDSGMDLGDFAAHPLAAHALLLYTTASHQDSPGKHRFRVVFQLAERITDPSLYKALINVLIRALGGDKSCNDPCRLYYSCSYGEQQLFNPANRLPGNLLEQASREQRREQLRFDNSVQDYDESTILQAIFVLEQVLEPTADGQRDLFVRVTAAAASAGSVIYPAWSDWASRGHHGKGKNSGQTSERYFRGFSGRTTLATLFFLASEQDAEWRRNLPDELRSTGFTVAVPAAGYSHEDFLGSPEDLDDLPGSTTTQTLARTPSLFEADPNVWLKLNDTPAAQAPPLADDDEDDDDDFLDPDFDDSGDPLKKYSGKKGKDSGQNEVATMRGLVEQLYPGLRLNQINLRLEYGTKRNPQVLVDPLLAWVAVSEKANKVYPKSHIADIVATVSQSNPYNPVKAYLEYCYSNCEPIPYFNNLASTLLGVPEEGPRNPRMPSGELFADLALKRFLVGAVARALNPGCSHAWMLILVGPQNLGKSFFFQYLTPPDSLEGGYPWVGTVQQGISYLKDKPHVLHAGWIALLDEVERYFKRQYTEELKNLVSVSVDRSARKWENERSFPRAFVMAGNTNSEAFLVDPTGNRRFMPVTVLGKVPSPENPDIKIIDLDRVKQDRNAIWAAAYRAYMDHPVHEFSSYELSQLSEYTSSHVVDSPIGEALRQAMERNCSFLVDDRPAYTMKDIFHWLDLGLESSTSMTRQISDELRKMGYLNASRRIAGKVHRIWQLP